MREIQPPLQYLQKWLSVDFHTSVILLYNKVHLTFYLENKSNISGKILAYNGQANSSKKLKRM